MQLPTLLSRRKPNVYKNKFGHALILAGSKQMLGAAALSSLSAIRSGCGLVTSGIPESLNSTAQKKISNEIMTLPLKETKEQSVAFSAFRQVQNLYSKYNVIAIGPGMTTHPGTQKFILKIIAASPHPLIIDADAINTIAGNLKILTLTKTIKILTPHPEEMARLTNLKKKFIESNRKKVAVGFAIKYNCILLLKGSRTIVASEKGKIYINKTGNPGMATAGSGDVLTGMIAAFVGQGLPAFDATKYGAYLHGKAGDMAAKSKSRLSMIASDIIDFIPEAIKNT